jgi:hypothetical protein
MRFAEHMLLEAKNYPLAPYYRHGDNGERCALGLVDGEGSQLAEQIYPWTAQTLATLPCKCQMAFCNWPIANREFPEQVCLIIVHLFNEHVMQGGRQQTTKGCTHGPLEPWTMEQLADWINSVDPTPDEPDDHEKKEPEEEEEPESLPAAITL